MRQQKSGYRPGGDEGFALITVMIFVFIVGIVGFSLFASAYYENRQARGRQESTEAFGLSDGAIEGARGEFLLDRDWRGPIPDTYQGSGYYNLVATDSTWTDGDDAILLHAEGFVGPAARGVEAWVRVPPAALLIPILAMDDIDVGGNLCLDGHAHANDEADFGPGDVHLKCDGTYTEGFEIRPPEFFTEPQNYPNTTYYWLSPRKGAGPVPDHARIYLYDHATGDTLDVTTAKGDSLTGIISSSGPAQFDYDFGKADIPVYFDYTTGIFSLDGGAGHTAVIVNFGQDVFAAPFTANLELQQSTGDPPIETTVFNTRYIGGPGGDRLDWNDWTGGILRVKTAGSFAPRNGLSFASHDMDLSNAQVRLGTEDAPALSYVTRDVDKIMGGLELQGSIICLRNFVSTGGPDITYDPGYLEFLPEYLLDAFNQGASGTMVVLEWKEVGITP